MSGRPPQRNEETTPPEREAASASPERDFAPPSQLPAEGSEASAEDRPSSAAAREAQQDPLSPDAERDVPQGERPRERDPQPGAQRRDGDPPSPGGNAQRYRARPRPRTAPRPRSVAAARMFETRSQAWREAGLLRQISPRVVRRARIEALLFVPVFVAIAVLYEYRKSLFHGLGAYGAPVRIIAVFVLMATGWVIARALGRAFGPALFRRLDPPTAGTVGFLLRLVTLIACFVVALRVANVSPQTLAIGGAVTAVVLGLAAQQTLGNVIAGIVLLSASPFRVGDRIHLQGGALGGPVEGVVGSLGLFYTTLHRDDGSTMLPNSVLLNALLIRDDEPESSS